MLELRHGDILHLDLEGPLVIDCFHCLSGRHVDVFQVFSEWLKPLPKRQGMVKQKRRFHEYSAWQLMYLQGMFFFHAF
jgi:hypothetical protein